MLMATDRRLERREFERTYAVTAGLTLAGLRRTGHPEPCSCTQPDCPGWRWATRHGPWTHRPPENPQ